MKYGKRRKNDAENELLDGVTLIECRIFIIRKAREYYQEFGYMVQNDVFVNDVFIEYYHGKKWEKDFPEWLVKVKVAEVRKYYMDRITANQIDILF